jgi:predicted small secreted protein
MKAYWRSAIAILLLLSCMGLSGCYTAGYLAGTLVGMLP